MSAAAVLVLVALLAPPALYGLAIAIAVLRAGRRAAAFDQHVADIQTIVRHPAFRCLVCDRYVDHPPTHSRLFHARQPLGTEDTDAWSHN